MAYKGGTVTTEYMKRVQDAVERATAGHNRFTSWAGNRGDYTVSFTLTDLRAVLADNELLRARLLSCVQALEAEPVIAAHALRGDRYKYIHYHGIWDTDELYDLQNDPLESTNLIFSEAHQTIIKQMNQQLFETLRESTGMYIPLYADRGGVNRLRRKGGSKNADFPPQFVQENGVTNDRRR